MKYKWSLDLNFVLIVTPQKASSQLGRFEKDTCTCTCIMDGQSIFEFLGRNEFPKVEQACLHCGGAEEHRYLTAAQLRGEDVSTHVLYMYVVYCTVLYSTCTVKFTKNANWHTFYIYMSSNSFSSF
jgi:hypothetical protein